MSYVRSFATVVLAVALVATLVTANVVAAAHLTVLDPDFVTNSIEEEGGYGMVEDAMRGAAGVDAASDGTAAAATGPVDTSAILQNALSEQFVRSQTEANVERAYAYLHGDAETLNLSVSTAPVRENVSAAIEAQIRNASVAELVRGSDATLSGPVNVTVLERMTANQSSYRAVKSDVRSGIRDRVLDAAVDEAFADASNDELLALVIPDYDPRKYSEAEKERMVADREAEIRTALRERIQQERGDEIDRKVEGQLAAMRDRATPENGTADTESGAAVAAIQTTVARGLTTNMTYEAFSENLSTAKADLATATADRADERLRQEMPARVDLTENMGPGAREGFAQARTAVQWLDRLAFVLPAVALALIGLLYYVRRSVTATASATGWSMLVAGVPTAVGVAYARTRLGAFLPTSGDGGPGVAVMVGVVERTMGTVGDVALALTAGGVLLVAGSLAVRYGLLDAVRERAGGASDGNGKL